MHEVGQSKLMLWDNPEGWGAEGGLRTGRHMHTLG